MKIFEIENEKLEDIINSTPDIIVDFFATWCGPCKMMGKVFESMSDDVDNISVCKIDVDKRPELAQMYRVVSVPTIIFFKDGKEIQKFTGALSKGKMLEEISAIY
ncbi:MAG: thioredoxin [Eubacterium sp.]